MNVTILADNTVATGIPKGLRGEWGFAAAVDDVLFDTGQSTAALDNARLLDVGTAFDDIVLSHAHYDHTMGLDEFLDPFDKPTVYCHPDIWAERFIRKPADGRTLDEPIHIGVPFSRAEVETGADIIEHRDPVEVRDGVFALGEIPRPHDDNPVHLREKDGELVDDSVPDDQSIAVETEDGTALVLGCCHAGLRNTIEHAETVTGTEVRFVIGGTHLVARDADEIHDLADWLEGQLDLFAGTHCTGFQAEKILSERLPEAFRSVGVGSSLELPPRV
ncbi:MBL fold metallo-hydrolase [Natrinema salaciae]|uniref:7,8-dihydropterin-6-yl-methyl-4-(Beta-D-ribofuranosyl)aminobenzene 5'-phosphate synthase n=1 Tax=Natrinema salaciae TaxID=1186196 RepID=A0A1H9S7T1_9EURY|nr:MBL fold metallo-hydrolase [Natrinema salaciae]SER81047.1 7,8-dihydropterin-6-yl-methyl-4-(beta-D-ribofuranosyl)aminobenzene 5'-phosphate synthase [Natrinema salaciae]